MSNFIPDLIVDTIYDISFEYLAEKKIKGIIFDLDNTMAGYSEALPNEKLVSWLENVSHAGFSIVIVSNNGKERVEKFNKDLKLPFISNAKKPLLGAYHKAKDLLSFDSSNIAVVGDQIFTDVFGGNRMGMTTILVSPIEKGENIFFHLKRSLEQPFINRYHRRDKKGGR